MKLFTKLLVPTLFLLLFGIVPQAQAQFSLGAGASSLKFLGSGSEKPRALGLEVRLGADINSKAALVVIPSFYAPVKYEYNSNMNVNNVPTLTISKEKINIVRTSALLQYNLIGDNGTSHIYVMGGPGVVFYDAKIDRSIASNGNDLPDYDVSTSFNDLILDARVGGTISFGFFGMYLETGIAPTIVSNLKDNPNYTPERGAQWTANLGFRFHFI